MKCTVRASVFQRTIDRAVTIRPLMETTRTSDRAASADNGPLPVPQFPPIAAPVPETLVVPERVVHVRIGAIEIHAAAAPPAAPAAAAPPPPANVSSGESGFDRYARLRSYAAWDR